MNEKLYDLAALDMDGTLLNSDNDITPYTREALRRADEAGKVIALCTGRSLSELRYQLVKVPAVRYAISESGGCLYDVRNDQVMRQLSIEREKGERLFDLARGYDVLYQVFFGSQSYMEPADATDRMAHWNVAQFRINYVMGSKFVTDVRSLWRESGLPLEKFNLYFTSARERQRFREEMGDMGLFDADGQGPSGIEISPPDAKKSLGLKALCERLGIPVERSMAVGDGGNDIDLMSAAGFSVAMGNAVREVLDLADATTEDCDHDGAAKAVLRYMLGEQV